MLVISPYTTLFSTWLQDQKVGIKSFFKKCLFWTYPKWHFQVLSSPKVHFFIVRSWLPKILSINGKKSSSHSWGSIKLKRSKIRTFQIALVNMSMYISQFHLLVVYFSFIYHRVWSQKLWRVQWYLVDIIQTKLNWRNY